MTTLQTLDRGLATLEAVSARPDGLSIAEIAELLGTHRAIAYRVVATLEAHRLVSRAEAGRIVLGAGAAVIGARFAASLRGAARPALAALAQETLATSFLAVAEGQECVVVAVAEPAGTLLRVGYIVGTRHPLARGASGQAILAARPAAPGDDPAIRRAREAGYSVTRGELQAGAIGVARGLGPAASGVEASVGVVALEGLDVEVAGASVVAAATRIRALL